MTAGVSMLLKSRPSPDMLPFSLCNKKSLAIRHINRTLFPTTLSIPSYDIVNLVGLRTYRHPNVDNSSWRSLVWPFVRLPLKVFGCSLPVHEEVSRNLRSRSCGETGPLTSRFFSLLQMTAHCWQVYRKLHFGMFYCLLKPYLCRSGEALTVPGGWGSKIARQSAHEGDKVFSPMLRPPLLPGNTPVTDLCQRLSWPQCGRKDYVNEKCQRLRRECITSQKTFAGWQRELKKGH
jgi:hypothetical protein